MDVTASPTTWDEVRSFAEKHLPADLRDALAKFGSERVVDLSLPYGAHLIDDGNFCWDLLGEERSWKDEYGVSIPLALVATKSVELYDLVTHMSRHTSRQGKAMPPREVTRSAPLFMTEAGTFFGLFENFSEDIGQPPLRATAGGTTLMVLPPIGTSKLLGQFLRGLELGRKNKEIEKYAENLRTTTRSEMAFGPFFARILEERHCPWRCNVIVFSPQFLAKIKRSGKAAFAITKMTLSQMALSHRRANTINRILQEHPDAEERAREDHVQSLRFIAQGTRPGFAPVLGTKRDEEVLPARALHTLIFPEGEEARKRKPLDPSECFPHLLRPSLPGEACFYFLARPYSGIYVRELEAAEERVDRILTALGNNGEITDGTFWHATSDALGEYLASLSLGARPIKLPGSGSNLLRWGMIGYTPASPVPGLDNC